MSCRRLSRRARQEQDFWLAYAPHEPEPTEDQRLEFLRFDSHGGPAPSQNPIYVGKCRYGMLGEFMREWRWSGDPSWPGGIEILSWEPVRTLIDWFGYQSVNSWATAAFHQWTWEENEPRTASMGDVLRRR